MERKRIVLGFSGGVDSLTAARLLKEEGYEVIPLFLDMGGSGLEELRVRARAAAATLGLKLREEEVAALFRSEVIDYLKSSYLRAETPSPCLRCNAAVKFTALAAVAGRLGVAEIATGHYFRSRPDGDGGVRSYLQAVDGAKDQSYFLSLVPERILRRARFPLGGMYKSEVVDLAGQAGYDLTGYRESQELCFLNGEDYRDFLRREGLGGSGPGPIVDLEGRELGRHRGLENYTVGQRRGLDIAWSEPLYVLRLDYPGNRLIVGSRRETGCRKFAVTDLNWLIPIPEGATELELSCQIRYRHRPAPARLRFSADREKVLVAFAEPQFAVAPGQGAAFYQGERLLGGGIISRAPGES